MRARAPELAAAPGGWRADSGCRTSPVARLRTRDTPERLLLFTSFGTATASFIYEIDWIRMLALVLGSATHAFELMLSAFILGLALGAFWIRGRIDRLAGIRSVRLG